VLAVLACAICCATSRRHFRWAPCSALRNMVLHACHVSTTRCAKTTKGRLGRRRVHSELIDIAMVTFCLKCMPYSSFGRVHGPLERNMGSFLRYWYLSRRARSPGSNTHSVLLCQSTSLYFNPTSSGQNEAFLAVEQLAFYHKQTRNESEMWELCVL
jgi:hypothetical protein